jgi:diaminohydroxyphosphoribosylaminopyrimidine deaminase / 5-amino-6-(5-phosphoribosylamino)uracil reductase
LRVIVDSRLETPPMARILPPPGAVLIYHAEDHPARRSALAAACAELACLPGTGGKVDLGAMLADLARRGINELHVEAGHKLNGSFVREDRVDEYLIYLAPKLIGQGREMMRFGPIDGLDDAPGRDRF